MTFQNAKKTTVSITALILAGALSPVAFAQVTDIETETTVETEIMTEELDPAVSTETEVEVEGALNPYGDTDEIEADELIELETPELDLDMEASVDAETDLNGQDAELSAATLFAGADIYTETGAWLGTVSEIERNDNGELVSVTLDGYSDVIVADDIIFADGKAMTSVSLSELTN